MDELTSRHFLGVDKKELKDHHDHLAAASGLTGALIDLYANEGVVNVPAWRHIHQLVDRTASWLAELDLDANEPTMPF